jgi:hypothetical protein
MDDFLSSGNSLPAISFREVGDRAEGVITNTRKLEDRDMDGELRTWPNGDPKHVWVFDIDTDEGAAAIWVRGNMVTAIKEAASKAKISTMIGAKLTVEHHALGEPAKKGYNAPKLYRAKMEAGQAAGDGDWL